MKLLANAIPAEALLSVYIHFLTRTAGRSRGMAGRSSQTLVQVIAGEMFGGVQREGRVVKPRHALPASIRAFVPESVGCVEAAHDDQVGRTERSRRPPFIKFPISLRPKSVERVGGRSAQGRSKGLARAQAGASSPLRSP